MWQLEIKKVRNLLRTLTLQVRGESQYVLISFFVTNGYRKRTGW